MKNHFPLLIIVKDESVKNCVFFMIDNGHSTSWHHCFPSDSIRCTNRFKRIMAIDVKYSDSSKVVKLSDIVVTGFMC